MQVVALIDCDNFFVSCERVFKPYLAKKPIVVLSNNSRDIISCSDEAKKLGLKSEAYFKVKDFYQANNIEIFTSNYALYSDMSARVMAVLQELVPEVEVYSVDEAFINLSHIPSGRLEKFVEDIREKILKDTGIPVSIGISTTKSLAKVAQNIAKKNKQTGIYKLLNEEEQTKALSIIDISEIWGIGKKSIKILEELGVHTALQFRDMDTAIVRKYLKLTGQKLQHELKNISSFEMEQMHDSGQNIAISRSFSSAVNKLEEIENFITEFVARATVKLQRQNRICSGIYVYVRTGAFNYAKKYSSNSIEYFDNATADVTILNAAAKRALYRIFKENYNFKKMGIILLNLTENDTIKPEFFEIGQINEIHHMNMINILKNKIKGQTFFSLPQEKKNLLSNLTICSNSYTTKWTELLCVS